jgi:murein L,D-transpeptidase YafK
VRWLPILLLFLVGCGPATLEPSQPLPLADLVLVDKSDRTLRVYGGGKLLRTYHDLQFGGGLEGHKRFQGDERTPEGR